MGDGAKDYTEVQVNNIHCSPLIYQASHFMVWVYQAGQAWVPLGDCCFQLWRYCMCFKRGTNKVPVGLVIRFQFWGSNLQRGWAEVLEALSSAGCDFPDSWSSRWRLHKVCKQKTKFCTDQHWGNSSDAAVIFPKYITTSLIKENVTAAPCAQLNTNSQ